MSNTDQAQEPSMEEILASIRKIISDDDGDEQTDASDDSASQASAEEVAQSIEDVSIEDPQEPETARESQSEVDEDLDFDSVAEIPEEIEEEPQEDDEEIFELTEEISPKEAAPHQDTSDASEKSAMEGLLEDADDDPLSPQDLMETSTDDDVVFAEEPEADFDTDLTVEAPEMAEKPAAKISTADETAGEALLSENSGASVASSFSSLENLVMTTQSRTIEDLLQSILRPMLREWLDGNLPPLVERLVREEIERVSRGRR
ncbi:MAG: DUF2497 domain-containing protein [Fimbriimonadaceae bacterium]|nr:DUF2497 domain-containing protein [Alphaproteobacteria bacterium]